MHTSVPTLCFSPSRWLDVGGSPLWKIQKGWKLFSTSSCFAPPPSTTAWLTSSLCKQPPPLSQRHSRCGTEWLLLCWALSQISLHSRSRAQHAGKCFTCCFIQNIHKEPRADTQRTQATPPLIRIGQWLLWRQAGRHSNRLSDLLFIFCLAGICCNVADDILTFGEAGK